MEWAAGEPAWVAKALEETSKPKMDAPSLPNFDFADQGLDYESLTLARMRRAERERLEREIREQEGE
ncbi:hypothetical protein DACRYDRAFT_107191 [Dacryopinax primogenitus]|uniref:Uncharacterized protein n=1 Tax=Dacryopinax primogenitus (strain DJM 731) TaxID=1858805 RepID=M5FWF7_DACPD|nr:uncharacterized protein DACRYDRAFT_107191 [Dacryopinax primogenitus]EJU02261.1 hypothetical protein DACRYDRAFT_107191 [Dacryopinax primogenitus]